MLQLRVMLSRMRQAGYLTLLRLVGITLAALLASSVPVFVGASMDKVLKEQLQAMEEPPAVVLSWTSEDEEQHKDALQDVDAYLTRTFLDDAGLSDQTPVVAISSIGQRPVQGIQPDGKLKSARRYMGIGALPDGAADPAGLPLVSGRWPAAGKAEVVLTQEAAIKAGYQIGDALRVPLTSGSALPAVDVTLVGLIGLPEKGPLALLEGSLSNLLMTSPAYFATIDQPVGERTWAIDLSTAQLHPARLVYLAGALQSLPLQTTRVLTGIDVVSSPQTWVQAFIAQMTATRNLLVVLLTPVFLLVLFFTLSTANAVMRGRRIEVAVLRSRGLTPLRVIGYYALESITLVTAAAGLALLLTRPAVQLMGLSAGFLKLVDRPLFPVALTWEAVLYAGGAALFAELVALWPLAREVRLNVATIRQEEASSPLLWRLLQGMLEIAVLTVVAYGTWRLIRTGAADDSLFLALPALSLAAVGLLIWRMLNLLMVGLWPILQRWLSPSMHLAFGLLRHQPGRYQTMWLMLVVTAGLGIYGAAFARTLDRDLVALSQYRIGTDAVIQAAWESEVLSVDANGDPETVVYREPPYSQFQGLPGATGTARVQLREEITLTAGTRNLGKVDLIAMNPQEFGLTARFLGELTARKPAEYLSLLAADEQSILLSVETASRLGIKVGDRLKLKDSDGEITVSVVGLVGYWPGRLPADGDFAVGRLEYVQDGLGLEPYDIWLRVESGTSLIPIAEELSARKARVLALDDRRSAVAAGRREPMRLALYSTLSVGFVMALAVMILTYLLHVGLTLQMRAKELGVLQAMGMQARGVAASLYTEQLIMVGTAALTGLGAGALAGSVYVPILRRQPGADLLPLKVTTALSDQMYLVIGFVVAIAIGVGVVAVWLRSLAVTRALRLGEDG